MSRQSRQGVALFLALGITLGLFWVMQSLIGGSELATSEKRAGIMAELIRLEQPEKTVWEQAREEPQAPERPQTTPTPQVPRLPQPSPKLEAPPQAPTLPTPALALAEPVFQPNLDLATLPLAMPVTKPPTGPAELAESVESIKPAKSAELAKPAGPAELARSGKPVESVKPAKPAKLAKPAGPVESLEPAESTKSAEPAESRGPALYSQALRPIYQIKPQFPRRARLAGISGWVRLKFTVAADGSVDDIQVLEAEPRRGLFDQEAVRALSRWRFHPQIIDGQRVAALATITIKFDLTER